MWCPTQEAVLYCVHQQKGKHEKSAQCRVEQKGVGMN